MVTRNAQTELERLTPLGKAIAVCSGAWMYAELDFPILLLGIQLLWLLPAAFHGRLSCHLFPRPFENRCRDDKVPVRDETSRLPAGAFKIVRLAGAQLAERVKMGVFHHQSFFMLVQKESDLGGGGGILKKQGILDHFIEVEEFN
jgi:hypothetical protein